MPALLDRFGLDVTRWRWRRPTASPTACANWSRQRTERGTQVFVAAAGMAAHLPGVVAS